MGRKYEIHLALEPSLIILVVIIINCHDYTHSWMSSDMTTYRTFKSYCFNNGRAVPYWKKGSNFQ